MADNQDEKRVRSLTAKALGNAIQSKRKEVGQQHKKLREAIQSASEINEYNQAVVCDLEDATGALNTVIRELVGLYNQDKYKEHETTLLINEYEALSSAYAIINKIKSKRTDKSSERSSRRSHKSLSVASTSSSARLRAAAAGEAAAARKDAEYERLIAEKEHERRKRELEDQSRREKERADYEKEMAILSANKKAAVANAKLEAIDQAIGSEGSEIGDDFDRKPPIDNRIEEWVKEQQKIPHYDLEESKPRRNSPPHPTSAIPKDFVTPPFRNGNYPIGFPHVNPYYASTPVRDITGSQLVEALTTSNQQMVSSLAKQSLPKCHPDTFNGDATLFHPWKKAFKTMISEAEITADQEINYLRKFTAGEVQRVVDNFRKRYQHEPRKLLKDLWTELERRFGSPAVITNALLERLHDSATFSEDDNIRLQEFADVCADIDSQIESLPGLACLNFPNTIRPIVERMPPTLRSKWEKEVATFAERNLDAYPGFHILTQVIQKQARLRNHPNIIAGSRPSARRRTDRRALATKFSQSPNPTTATTRDRKGDGIEHCVYHDRDGHNLTDCRDFKSKSLEEKTSWIQKAGLCFLCLSRDHRAKDCTLKTSCEICGDDRHITLLHKERENDQATPREVDHLGNVNAKCTAICGELKGGVTCSKIVLVDVFLKARPGNSTRVYAIIDDQSNASLISSKLADTLGENGHPEKYFLSTCSGNNEVKYGRRVSGLVVRSIQNGKEAELPTLVECDAIPEDKGEIPTPEIAKMFPHLQDIAKEIPPVEQDADVHILLGRDAPELLKVRAFKNGPRGAPWAQKLFLGWTVSGRACLDSAHGPVHIQTRRTNVRGDTDTLSNRFRTNRSRESFLDGEEECEVVPCPNTFKVTDGQARTYANSAKDDVFYRRPDDNDVSHSLEDFKFLDIMEGGIVKNDHGNWEMPLPFRQQEVNMPNNKPQATQRFRSLTRTLNRKPQMKQDYFEFMEKIIRKGHATAIPANEIEVPDGKVWYLPHFGVYHPKKPTQIRVVFDSSSEYNDVSLNKELIPGPDLANSLAGVLIRFRRESVAVMCDVEQMFHSFHVSPKHRDFLRFLWFEDNDPKKAITEYRMNVHLFGNGPSPAVATFGLRRTVNHGEEITDEVREFVNRNFYVDDGLASAPTPEQAVSLVIQTQSVLATANLRLHKVVSNSREVMRAFPTADIAKDFKDLDITQDSLPAQRSLGVYWNLENDSFTFRVAPPNKPYTRRGVLAVVNSVYDPLGLAAPVTINGKKLLQQLVVLSKQTSDQAPLGWDDPLPEKLLNKWQDWKDDLKNLEGVKVPRCYHPQDFGAIMRAELHAFSDASQDAIGAAVYLRLINQNGDVNVTLVFGQAKVAPVRPTSIPRLELCGAVLATQAVSKILKELDMEISEVVYYTDSQVVLGYITNERRRFYVYVANRVQLIRSSSLPEQWRYVESGRNPADLATRGIRATNLQLSLWLNGPHFLRTSEGIPPFKETHVRENDPEVRKDLLVCKTKLQEVRRPSLGAERFTRFSSFSSLQRALAHLIARAKEFKTQQENGQNEQTTKDLRLRPPTSEELQRATNLIIKECQRAALGEEIRRKGKGQDPQLEECKPETTKQTDLRRLDAFLDEDGILRVGGRLKQMSADYGEKHPVLLPKGHHVSRLLVRHFHKLTHHQGRQITHGALRQGGYWLLGGHRLVAKELHSCVICRKLRGGALIQRMSELPADRMETGPPFTNVGLDVFGPWMVSARRTRGGAANSKRWGLILTCLSSRAIHIEVLETMDASAFICALRRFFALRGPAALLRCDNGTNFVGGKNELEESLKEMDQKKIERFVAEQGCEWKFNPPYSSHFGGVWERQIGTVRRVLDAMFAELDRAQLTHEILVTLMAEVTAIVNSRPITSIPTDTDDPQPLSPSMLLTMKTRPLGPLPGEFVPTDLYARRRWRRVQYLADQFWTRWRREYIQNLQKRSKWQGKHRNLAIGDVVIVREEGQYRNDWPLGRVLDAHASGDGLVRKATIAVVKDGKAKTLLRPIKELVLLVPTE